MKAKTLLWFRQDLRLSDNPALHEAAKNGKIMPVYILDETREDFKMGEASSWWLYKSLRDLDMSLNNSLNFYKCKAIDVIMSLVKDHNIDAVYWNRCYEPWRIRDDAEIKSALKAIGVECHSYKASLLYEPWETTKEDNTPYKVFTPFYRKLRNHDKLLGNPLPKPERMDLIKSSKTSIDDLDLLPKLNWYSSIEQNWIPGEKNALQKLEDFLENGLINYKEGRNFPAKNNVSRLSPHLHFGEISPRQIWHKVTSAAADYSAQDIDHFLSELGWREFAYHLLYYFPDLTRKNFQQKFDAFPWQNDESLLKAWQMGKTGYPIVDAGMRELWQTGYMHNRLRMIVGSFLVKNLLIHWHKGEEWFWDCLVDADLANNSLGWQWIAGSGVDAAPYFRIFNPITQGEKFDPEGVYTKKFLPELKDLPLKYLFKPWETPDFILKGAGVRLGDNYPKPIVDLAFSRNRALDLYKKL